MHVALVPRVHASLLQPDGTKLLFGDSKLAGAEAAKCLFVRLRVQRQLELMNPKQAFTPKIVKSNVCKRFRAISAPMHLITACQGVQGSKRSQDGESENIDVFHKKWYTHPEFSSVVFALKGWIRWNFSNRFLKAS